MLLIKYSKQEDPDNPPNSQRVKPHKNLKLCGFRCGAFPYPRVGHTVVGKVGNNTSWQLIFRLHVPVIQVVLIHILGQLLINPNNVLKASIHDDRDSDARYNHPSNHLDNEYSFQGKDENIYNVHIKTLPLRSLLYQCSFHRQNHQHIYPLRFHLYHQ